MSADSNPPFMTVRQSLAELDALIPSQTQLLAREPSSYSYQLSVRSLELRRENLLGFERIPLRYVGTLPDDVARLLGPAGPAILGNISDLITSAALESGWPLEALEVRWQTDPEIERIEDILVVLRLRTSFDRADEILKSLYPEIQSLTDSLSGAARSVLTDKISFDIEALW